MANDYSTLYAQMQDVSGLTPVFQNISAQQALHNQLMQQQQQEMQNAGNIGASYGKGMGGLNPMAMASMLRSKNPGMMGNQQTPNWQNPYANYDNGAFLGSSGIE
jgi:hypothetical protein